MAQHACRFFGSPRGCRQGTACPYAHAAASASPTPPSTSTSTPCRFFATPRGCFNGESCWFAHTDPAFPAPHGAAPPAVVYAVAPDTPERTLKFVGMRAFGCGAEVLPFCGLREARAVRLVCTHFHVAVDRRVWPVRDEMSATASMSACM
jgi:hypothetical protein